MPKFTTKTAKENGSKGGKKAAKKLKRLGKEEVKRRMTALSILAKAKRKKV